MIKSQLTNNISDPQINDWYRRGIKAGAKGGKLLGAGNGGFIMFFAPESNHHAIIAELQELKTMKFGFDRNGAQIVFYTPTNN
jgi:D-glycero-alpha-D-manno-heptose-7-phosphate kinase